MRMDRADRAGFPWLDFKVGFRMLQRYPGLSVIGTVALAVAIALGTIYFEGLNKLVNPRLPVRDADRVVSIRNWDIVEFSPEERVLHDFASWREQVTTIDELGAAIGFVRNLATGDGRVEPVRGAEMTASGFRLMATLPLLGRTFTDLDEDPAEPPVVVISHALWNTRFARDPEVVGRTVRLGTSTATIVGVMPEGFGFPRNERIWTPLRVDGSLVAPGTGPPVSVFGRLAPGVSRQEAQAEFDAIGARMAAENPQTYRDLNPRVTAYGRPPIEGGEGAMIRNILYAVNGIFLLLAVISANVATLVFARTATRSWDITVRNALGASRGRIVTQLFVEALVLTGVATVLGLIIARVGMSWALRLAGGAEGLPFWLDASLSWKTGLYACLLAVFGAAVIGILPALRLTRGQRAGRPAKRESAAGANLRFGGFWTTVIVVQVAFTVAFLPLAAGGVSESNCFRQRAEGIGAENYLIASVAVDQEDHATDPATFAARARARFDELERRLSAEPGIEQVAFADRMPVEDQFKYTIGVDTAFGAPSTGLRVSTLVNVSHGFFETFGTSVVSGRDFEPLDYETGRVMIVNESFARYVLASGTRSASASASWRARSAAWRATPATRSLEWSATSAGSSPGPMSRQRCICPARPVATSA